MDELTFPVELQNLIVDMVTEDIEYPVLPRAGVTYLNVQLTAKRFRSWVMPVIFRVLDVGIVRRYINAIGEDFLKNLLPAYGKHVKILWRESGPAFKADSRLLVSLIEHCPNIENLAICPSYSWDGTTHAFIHNAIKGLPHLKTMSCDIRDLPETQSPNPTILNVTHLDLKFHDLPIELLDQFQNIVHLCVGSSIFKHELLTYRLLDKKKPAWRSLRFITSEIGYDPLDMADGRNTPFYLPSDPRVVLIIPGIKMWSDHINGYMDFWEFSKRIVIGRQRGFFQSSEIKAYRNAQKGFNIEKELTEAGTKWWRHLDIIRTTSKGKEWWLEEPQ